MVGMYQVVVIITVVVVEDLINGWNQKYVYLVL